MVQVVSLDISGFRCLQNVALDLCPGLNVFLGGNGVGKTSILEAASVLGSGRSFRSGVLDSIIGHGLASFTVAAVIGRMGQRHRVGLQRRRNGSTLKVDGEVEKRMGSLARLCPIVVFEPQSHVMLSGGSEGRRSLFHWVMFHVEPQFAELWQRYQRLLVQRNAALKAEAEDAELSSWDSALTDAAEALRVLEQGYERPFGLAFERIAARLLPALSNAGLQVSPGWDGELLEALYNSRRRDRALGYTTEGPHRLDWSVEFTELPRRENFSRGQQKLCCLCAIFAAGELLVAQQGEYPLLAIDDLFSELDRAAQQRVLSYCAERPMQVLVSGIEAGPSLSAWTADKAMFHVEPFGRVTRLL